MAPLWGCGKYGCAIERFCEVWVFPTQSTGLPAGNSAQRPTCGVCGPVFARGEDEGDDRGEGEGEGEGGTDQNSNQRRMW